jgi:hypothetical protein
MNLNELVKEAKDVKLRQKGNGDLPIVVKYGDKNLVVHGLYVEEDHIELIL